MGSRRPLEPEIAAARGLTPAQRAELIAGAKRVALPFLHAIRAGHAASVQRIAAGLDRQQLAALATVLAEAADPLRLRVICETADQGMPEGIARTSRGHVTDVA